MKLMFTEDELINIVNRLKEDMGSTALDMFLTGEGDKVQSVMKAIVTTQPNTDGRIIPVVPIIGDKAYLEFERNGSKSGISVKWFDKYIIGDTLLDKNRTQTIARDAFKNKQICEVDGVKYVTIEVSSIN
jgi:hypothetical protein